MRRLQGVPAAWLVVLGGVAAALHVGKLPPALPVLRQTLGLGLVEAGFLLSLVQLAGMTLGLLVGLAADRFGLRRTMLTGLLVTGAASLAGGQASSVPLLLVLRGLEGLGFLLASMPAPALIRRLVPAQRMSAMLGVWGAYMPFATAAALLAGPAWIGWAGWMAWWWLLGVLSLGAALALAVAVPPDPGSPGPPLPWRAAIARTLRAPGPWMVALAFGAYSAQWLAVVGFLPAIYLEAGLAPATAAVATALAAAVNMGGNLASGRLLQRGVGARQLLTAGFLTMGAGSIVAFAPWGGDGAPAAAVRYAAILAFSLVGGIIPGTLFSLAVRVAPGEGTVSATVGWMQQWSALGQFAGPPLVAWVAARAGGWQWSWTVTTGCAACGLVLARWAGLLEARRGA
ncbi:MAG TPA: MFS transporter [Ramlibacter sp.]|jgi:MFS family permease|uniref:MFS transporter n=1 Tax=Ramlibacter sp. TaxID=1917967 RepID=UPI002D70DCB7|nr:MFS transporter [Ramlibacter sp.]HZY20097.1 MFS transporter [Ramlibacter sp.]